MKKSLSIASFAVGTIMAVAPFAALAQTTVTGSTGVDVNPIPLTSGTSVSGTVKGSASISTVMARGDAEITRRLTNLTSLSTRVGQVKNISASEKTSLQGSISTEISNLTALKATIDADTDIIKLKTDVGSITADYRIYMLVIPQGRIVAASDRVSTIVSDMQAISVQLSARISAAQTAGKNVAGAESAYADMQAKVSDANTQSQAALSETVSLQPDQGSASIEASNKAAIKDGAAKLKVAATDLKAARADITTIEAAVKGTGSASVTTSANVQ
jgi:hypothetical protein